MEMNKMLGDPMRGIEDLIEQNDNQLDGIINNIPLDTVSEKEAKSSVVEKIKMQIQAGEQKKQNQIQEKEQKPQKLCPDRELC